jgi:hypothetical protein
MAAEGALRMAWLVVAAVADERLDVPEIHHVAPTAGRQELAIR